MTTVEQIGDELAVHPDDIRVIVEQIVDLDDEVLPDHLAIELRQLLNPCGERNGPDPIRDLATQYRETHDRALLDELEVHGHRKVGHALTMERVYGDKPEAAAYTQQIDAWIAGGFVPHVLTWGH